MARASFSRKDVPRGWHGVLQVAPSFLGMVLLLFQMHRETDGEEGHMGTRVESFVLPELSPWRLGGGEGR